MQMIQHLKNLIHPILAGFCAFLATVIGSYCFNLQNPWYVVALGFGIFLMANNGLYKFKFNSYNLNGVTVTTILIFVSQAGSMLVWKGDQVKATWIVGVILIMVGVTLLEKNKPRKIQVHDKNQ